MQRRRVVLPDPERPMTMTVSRRRTSRSTPRRTWFVAEVLLDPGGLTMTSPRASPYLEPPVAAVAPRSGRGSWVIGRRVPCGARAAPGKCEKTMVMTQYTAAAMSSVSSERKFCGADLVLARHSSSWTAMIETSAESLIMAMNSLPMAGDHDAQRLRQDDPAHDAALGHARAPQRGLALARRHGLDAGAEDLGHIGAVVEGQRDDAGRDRRAARCTSCGRPK